jgi:hypothetical protein
VLEITSAQVKTLRLNSPTAAKLGSTCADQTEIFGASKVF